MGEIEKGFIGKEDLKVQTNTDATETFNRATSTGGVVALEKIPDIWDGTGHINIKKLTLNAVALDSITAFAETILDDADAATVLATLGLTVTAFAKTILDDANAATVLATLGLTVTAFAKTILDDANAATVLATLGLTETPSFISASKGWLNRPKFTQKSDNDIYVGPGGYELNGKYVYWVSQLTSDIGTPAASDWYYLYLDDSALTSSGLVTATELIWANTEPAWSHTKVGWYNGNDRCIFAVLTDGTSDIIEFYHDGDLVVFLDRVIDRAEADLARVTWTNVTLTIPKFTQKALVTFQMEYDAGSAAYYWRTDGQAAASTGHIVGYTEAGTTRCTNDTNVITSTSQIIEIYQTAAASDTEEIGVMTEGWYFPIGL